MAVDNGLEVEEDLLFLDKLPELPVGLERVGLLVEAAHAELRHPALLGALDLVHGKVGKPHQLPEIPAVLRIPGNAPGGGQGQLLSIWLEEPFPAHRFGEAVDRQADALPVPEAVKQQKEFIPGDPGAHRPRGDAGGKAARRLADIAVAAIMAEVVVDKFQVVQIQHQKRPVAHGFGVGKKALRLGIERPAVIKPCQQVIVPLVLHLHPFQNGGSHILRHSHPAVIQIGDLDPDVAGRVRGNGIDPAVVRPLVTGIALVQQPHSVEKHTHRQLLR